VLETLLARGVLVAATTHYPELKAFALSTAGVSNASVEFDAETLRPTYRLHVGLPGASNAFAIASRLGLDAEVLGRAEAHLSELHRSLERTLREAERHRTDLAGALDEARIAAEDARRATAEAERDAAKAREEGERALRRARARRTSCCCRRGALCARRSRRATKRRSAISSTRRARRSRAPNTRETSVAEPAPRASVPIAVGSPSCRRRERARRAHRGRRPWDGRRRGGRAATARPDVEPARGTRP
jgi:DNA mismatch repair protein MutS2